MALWLNRSGKHCEHESKFLAEGRIYLTWDGLDRDLGKLLDRAGLLTLLEDVYPKASPAQRRQNSGQIETVARKSGIRYPARA
ncbi:MAG TPA: hypothetical protein VMY42_03895 [Thermoguttaceae bacterium]|nr:hypothetical protein [Thermoguttaceae bacterium]